MPALRMLAVSFALVLFASAVTAATPRRLNQHIEDTFKSLMAARAFEPVLPHGWRAESFVTTVDRVEVSFSDDSGQQHAVELLLEAPQEGSAASRGRFFYFRLGRGAGVPQDARALLLAAGLIDAATTKEAFVAEEPPPPAQPRPLNLRTIPKGVALALGAMQTLIIIGAILLAVVLPTRRRGQQRVDAGS